MNNTGVPKNALFVCFGCMSNVGTLTGVAGLEAVKRSEPGKAGIFCLAGLATDAKTVIEKTEAAQRIVTVDGCPLNCARKLVERSGYTPDETLMLVESAGIQKRSGYQFEPDEFERAVEAILAAIK